jgi:hypothetical protein
MSGCTPVSTSAKPIQTMSASGQVLGNRDLLITVLTYMHPRFYPRCVATGRGGLFQPGDDRFAICELHTCGLVCKAWRRVIRPSAEEIEAAVEAAKKEGREIKRFPVSCSINAPRPGTTGDPTYERRSLSLLSIAFRSPVIFAQLSESPNLCITSEMWLGYEARYVSIHEIGTFQNIRGFQMGFHGPILNRAGNERIERVRLQSIAVIKDIPIRELRLHDLDNRTITDQDIALGLPSLQKLEKLTVSTTPAGPETYKALFLLPNLTDLDLSCGADGLLGQSAPVRAVLPLKVLSVWTRSSSEKVVDFLSRCPSLTKLALSRPDCDGDLPRLLARAMGPLKMLEDLSLKCAEAASFQPTEDGVEFGRHPALRRLEFLEVSFSKANFLRWMESCETITTLVLGKCGPGVADEDMAEALTKLPSLKCLSLSPQKADGKTAYVVHTLQKLIHLGVDSTQLSQWFWYSLQSRDLALNNLTSLFLRFPPYKPGPWIDEFGLRFSRLPSLTNLEIVMQPDPTCDDTPCLMLGQLGQLQKLEKLVLRSHAVKTSEAAIKFAGYPTLRELGLVGIGLSRNQFLSFARAAPALHNVSAYGCRGISEQDLSDAREILRQRQLTPPAATTAAAALS